jgi:AcrR family transcriptional regulator
MSTSISTALEPKRRRGHLRVAAIMEAGVEVFAEKGYDAATMAEIAARSGTAIGSLYRFFPSKESLADALLLRFAQRAFATLKELDTRASDIGPDAIAGALVDFLQGLQGERGLAIALVDAGGGSDIKRNQFRRALRRHLAGVLKKSAPRLSKERAETMAVVMLQVLKGVSAADDEDAKARRLLLAEIRQLLGLYIRSAQRG